MQLCMIGAGVLLVYLVLFATRDILSRTHSFVAQIGAIILVSVLPVVGFLLYLLIRPSTTNRQRKLERDVHEILKRLSGSHSGKRPHPHPNPKQHSKAKSAA